MQIGKLLITAPALGTPGSGTGEVFDAVIWMWMQAKTLGKLPLRDLSSTLVPALKCQQFILASAYMDGEFKPVAYLAWANMSAEAEARYLCNPTMAIKPADWASGDRMWITDWFTPFGHARSFQFSVGHLLAYRCARALYHRGDEDGRRVLHFRGDEVTRAQARQWWEERPLPDPMSRFADLTAALFALKRG